MSLTSTEEIDALLDSIMSRVVDRKEDLKTWLSDLEDDHNDRELVIDSTLTIKPQTLKKKPSYEEEEIHYGMIVEKSLGGVGRARDWVNSTKGFFSPFATDRGFLILSEDEYCSGKWIRAGELLTFNYGSFSTRAPYGYEMVEEPVERDANE